VLTEGISEADRTELQYAADVIGGRLADLSSLCYRVLRKGSIRDAFAEMVSEAKLDLITKGYSGDPDKVTTDYAWDKVQLWKTMTLIAEKDRIPYTELLHTVFENKKTATARSVNGANIEDIS